MYKVYVDWWSYGSSGHTLIVREYPAESEDEARDMFWDEYPPMLGTGTIRKVEKI